jgi:hypothetical protein
MGTREPVELKWEPYSGLYDSALVTLENGRRIMALHDTDKGGFAVGIIFKQECSAFWLDAEARVYNLGPLECLCMVEHYVEMYGP